MKRSIGYIKIAPQTLYKKLKDGENLVLIDTLTSDHYKKIHLPSAKNACVFEVVFIDKVGKIISDKETVVVVYGSSENSMDAVTAAEKLSRAGYRNIFALEGGMQQWKELGYEFEGEDPGGLEEGHPVFSMGRRTYFVDTEQSIIEWTGRNPNTKHYGTINLSKGEIFVRKGRISGKFEIDMKSIKNINLSGDPLQPVLISHLMSDDFFFVNSFPKATFTIKSSKLIKGATQSEPNFEVEGILELRGIKKDITFLATAVTKNNEEMKIESHFDIDRTRWGVIYGSARFFDFLGMHMVFDLISIQLRLVAR